VSIGRSLDVGTHGDGREGQKPAISRLAGGEGKGVGLTSDKSSAVVTVSAQSTTSSRLDVITTQCCATHRTPPDPKSTQTSRVKYESCNKFLRRQHRGRSLRSMTALLIVQRLVATYRTKPDPKSTQKTETGTQVKGTCRKLY